MKFKLYNLIENYVDIIIRRNVYLYNLCYFFINFVFINYKADILLDGYPRSANSYAIILLKTLNPDTIVIHHTHSIAPIKVAVTKKIPIYILIRNPYDAITSELIRRMAYGEGYQKIPFLIKYYLQYYEYVYHIINKVTIISFDELTNTPLSFYYKIKNRINVNINDEDFIKINNEILCKMNDSITDQNILSTSTFTTKRNYIKIEIKKHLINNYYKEMEKCFNLYIQILKYI